MNNIRLSRRTFVAGAATCAVGALAPVASLAQDAAKGTPITLVVPFAAGGATDVVARLVAKKLTDRTGRPVVVDNVAGAGGVVGASKVARGPKDGSMLLMGTVATHAINPLATTPAPYDPQRDFTPVSLLATVPNVLVVGPNVKARNVKELIALLKSQPGKFSYASSGIGTPPHLSGELFKAMAGVDILHVPYRGGGPAMTDLVAGHVPVLFDVLTGAASHIRNGSARALAVTTATRSPSFPDVPTMAEAGLPGYETYTWNAIFAPAGVPRSIIDPLAKELQRVIADPEVQEKLKDISANPVGSTPEALAAQVKAELDKWGPVIKSIGGLKLQ